MKEQSFLSPFPSWKQFFLFNLIFFIGMTVIGVLIISLFANELFDATKSYIIGQAVLFIFFVLSFLSFRGCSKANIAIIFLYIASIFYSIFLILIMGSKDLRLDIVIIFLSILSIILIRTSSYNEFVVYRGKHIKAAKKFRESFLNKPEE